MAQRLIIFILLYIKVNFVPIYMYVEMASFNLIKKKLNYIFKTSMVTMILKMKTESFLAYTVSYKTLILGWKKRKKK